MRSLSFRVEDVPWISGPGPGRARNQVACRLHAVLCGLVPGGVSKEITAAHATRILEQVTPPGAVARARHELAEEFLTDLRRLDTQLRESKKKLALVVRASGTTLTGLFGAGPVIAATVIGDVVDLTRFDGHPSSGVRPRKDVRPWRAWGKGPGAVVRSPRSSRPR
jgi:hypothetical protein